MATKSKKNAAKKVSAPSNTRMSIRIPARLMEDLSGLTNLPTGTALVIAARVGITHAAPKLKALLANVAAVRVGEV